MNKIEEQDLLKLRELNTKFSNLRSKIADIEIAIRNLNNQKRSVFFDLDATSTEFKSLEADMLDKYGNVTVNLDTGEIKDEIK